MPATCSEGGAAMRVWAAAGDKKEAARTDAAASTFVLERTNLVPWTGYWKPCVMCGLTFDRSGQRRA